MTIYGDRTEDDAEALPKHGTVIKIIKEDEAERIIEIQLGLGG